jgi:hypothetical protein
MKKITVLLIAMLAFAVIWGCDSGNGCNPVEPDDTITVTGPITGGKGIPQSASILNVAKRGYVEQEFFFEGEATGYELQGEMTMDGKWTVAETDRAAYKTRMLVIRPADASKFNGTVVVEWLNVSAGADGAPGYMFNYAEILREGAAWVGVSAQAVGVQGGGFAMVEGALPLKDYDPARYGSLNHPGDAYSFDIYSRAAKVIRGQGTADVLGGLKPQRLLAYGESQSAMTMITYTNAVQPVAKVYDGIFIHSRAAAGIPLGGGGGGCGAIMGGSATQVRTDLNVPVIQFETEGDITGFYTARQPDTNRIRTWEVAGTAHADAYLATFADKAEEGGATLPENVLTCENANEGPQYIVLRAALHALNRWVKDGIAPPSAPPITMEGNQVIRDEHGNALGGIRTPHVDVPIATLKPTNNSAGGQGCDAMMCAMFGATEPFSDAKLLQLYPTHADYVSKYTASANQASAAGFILEPEKQEIIAAAQAAPIP